MTLGEVSIKNKKVTTKDVSYMMTNMYALLVSEEKTTKLSVHYDHD